MSVVINNIMSTDTTTNSSTDDDLQTETRLSDNSTVGITLVGRSGKLKITYSPTTTSTSTSTSTSTNISTSTTTSTATSTSTSNTSTSTSTSTTNPPSTRFMILGWDKLEEIDSQGRFQQGILNFAAQRGLSWSTPAPPVSGTADDLGIPSIMTKLSISAGSSTSAHLKFFGRGGYGGGGGGGSSGRGTATDGSSRGTQYYSAPLTSTDMVLTMKVYLFTQDGSFTWAGQTWTVKSGQVKFTLNISNWPWLSTSNSLRFGMQMVSDNPDSQDDSIRTKRGSQTNALAINSGQLFIPSTVILDGTVYTSSSSIATASDTLSSDTSTTSSTSTTSDTSSASNTTTDTSSSTTTSSVPDKITTNIYASGRGIEWIFANFVNTLDYDPTLDVVSSPDLTTYTVIPNLTTTTTYVDSTATTPTDTSTSTTSTSSTSNTMMIIKGVVVAAAIASGLAYYYYYHFNNKQKTK